MTEVADYDSPWKEALEVYFPEFLALCFPEAHAGINWARGHEFLDKELQQITRDAELGRRLADKLVKVWLDDGSETWLLVHIEVQGQTDPAFAGRMYVYQYRIFDHYAREVVSLAVLGDETASWRPTSFGYTRWGCELRFRFPVLKLLDYWQTWSVLEESVNPFAVVIMAHLQAQATRRDDVERKAWKWTLIRQLYERGYARQDILQLFRFIDWLLALPLELEQALWQDIEAYEEAKRMTYVTSVERFGIQKGLEQGLEQGLQQGQLMRGREAILDVLETRFGSTPRNITRRVNQITNEMLLKQLLRQAILVSSLTEFARLLTDALSTEENTTHTPQCASG